MDAMPLILCILEKTSKDIFLAVCERMSTVSAFWFPFFFALLTFPLENC